MMIDSIHMNIDRNILMLMYLYMCLCMCLFICLFSGVILLPRLSMCQASFLMCCV